MCGIIGSLGYPLVFDRALAKIRHRGPDGEGMIRIDEVSLGHTRLAIQDTSQHAAQPFPVAWRRWLSYNGELWNAEALRAELPGPWTSTGDTEVVARALDTWGPADALARMDGMFAFAYLDGSDLWLATDTWGRVPLYVAETVEGVVFASEIKAMPYGVPARKVQPGTLLHVNTMTETESAYTGEIRALTPENVRDMLRTGIRERMVSDRPVCLAISGGLDSSLILGLAVEMGYEPVCYTAVHDPGTPDHVAARRIAEHYGVELVEVPVGRVDMMRVMRAVETVEHPMKAQVEIACAHLPLIQAMASDGFRVSLSGEAADELFGGYGNTAIKARKMSDVDYQGVKLALLDKMSRGNFSRVNKVGMAYGVECRLPFMQADLVESAVYATKAMNPLGKGAVKAAARGVVPDWCIDRVKDTFQGGTGVREACAAVVGPSAVKAYNDLARKRFGYLPRGGE